MRPLPRRRVQPHSRSFIRKRRRCSSFGSCMPRRHEAMASGVISRALLKPAAHARPIGVAGQNPLAYASGFYGRKQSSRCAPWHSRIPPRPAPSSSCPKNSNQPVMGYLVRQDERTVVVRQPLADGKSREVPFSRSNIDELIITVSPERLAALDPARPEMYREYAEELAEKQRDPEARDMARRLYAIAAVRAEGNLRRGASWGWSHRAPRRKKNASSARPHFSMIRSTTTHCSSIRWPPRRLTRACGTSRAARGPAADSPGTECQSRRLLERPDVQAELGSVSSFVTPAQLKVITAAGSPPNDNCWPYSARSWPWRARHNDAGRSSAGPRCGERHTALVVNDRRWRPRTAAGAAARRIHRV